MNTALIKMINRAFRSVKFIIAWFRIPKGQYCYFGSRGCRRCPYWRRIEDRPSIANGWCDYLGKGDIEIAAETEWILTHVGKDSELGRKVGDRINGSDLPGSSLLWDQCKECGIKEE